MPCSNYCVNNPNPIGQVVVQNKFCDVVLEVSNGKAGDLDVSKIYCIFLFFWSQLKCHVTAYIRTCHCCQLTAKSNQNIKTALLVPFPMAGKSFDHLIKDCVGPLSL